MKSFFNAPQEIHPERLWVIANIGEVKAKVILDLGCGRNKTIPEAIGVDIVWDTDIKGNAESFPFPKNEVDIIISRHCFEHLLDPIKTLENWYKILKIGGKIIMVIPDHEKMNTLDPFYSEGQHLHTYTMESLKNLISLFSLFEIEKLEVVIDYWSFGCVLRKL